MVKVTGIYLLAAALVFLPKCASAKTVPILNYDIDWISTNPRESILVITINNCPTKFIFKNDDVESFSKNKSAMSDAIKKAIEHVSTGCAK